MIYLLFLSVVICEHTRGKTIKCPSGTHMNILYALYGRQNITLFRVTSYMATRCSSENMERVHQDCQGKQECFMQATNRWIGDPYRGIEKYLEIEYQCLLNTNCKIHLSHLTCLKISQKL